MKSKFIGKNGVNNKLKNARENPKVFGGNIDYDSFGKYIDGRTHGALDRLSWIAQWNEVSLDEWPLAFKNLHQAEQFLKEISDEEVGWIRMTDNIAKLLGPYHTNGSWGDEVHPMANFADAARELRILKEDYFDKGKDWED